MNDYPKNWDKIAKTIKDLANWRCEHCNHEHEPETGYTLTVHHLDGNKAHNKYKNLVALCQRCHLSIQARYFPGQQVLFDDPPQWMIKRGLIHHKQKAE